MAAQRHEICVRVLKNNLRVSEQALLSNCFMMNLNLQHAAQRRFFFVECFVVKLLSCSA